MPAARFLVRGKVQGVFFRAATRERALQLQLDGDAINLPDGSVEVITCGEAASLEALAEWLRHGPPMARVDRLERLPWTQPVTAGFRTG